MKDEGILKLINDHDHQTENSFTLLFGWLAYIDSHAFLALVFFILKWYLLSGNLSIGLD